MVPVIHHVKRLMRETRDTFNMELVNLEGGTHSFLPGQFSMLYVFGMGEVPISISGDPSNSESLLYTIRDVGTVTHALHGLKVGNAVGVRGPFGSHWDLNKAQGKDVMVIAGGIGLAPLRPAIYSLIANRDKYNRIIILYGARTPRDILFARELEHWRGNFDLDVEITVDRARREWRGKVGVVPKLIGKMEFDPDNTVAMMCGPEVMMQLTLMDVIQRGVSEESIYITMERNMKCAVGFCGHCQYGPHFVCKNGPVFNYVDVKSIFSKREI